MKDDNSYIYVSMVLPLIGAVNLLDPEEIKRIIRTAIADNLAEPVQLKVRDCEYCICCGNRWTGIGGITEYCPNCGEMA